MEIQAPENTICSSSENNMETGSITKPPVGLIVAVSFQSILWIGVVMLLIKLVPGFQGIAEDFGAALPRISIFIIDVAYFFYTYWYGFIPLLVLFCVGDFVLSYYVFHRQGHDVIGRFWRLGMLAIPICCIILIFLGCSVSMVGIVVELS